MTQLKLNRRMMTWMTCVLVVVWPGVMFFLSSMPERQPMAVPVMVSDT